VQYATTVKIKITKITKSQKTGVWVFGWGFLGFFKFFGGFAWGF